MKRLLIILMIQLGITTSLMGQDIIVTNDGNTIKTYNTEIGNTVTYYQLEQSTDASILKISNSEILIIKFQDGTRVDPNAKEIVDNTTLATKTENTATMFPNIDLDNYHGFLLAKGNCVYLTTTNDTEYERAFIEGAKDVIKHYGYWTVVDSPEQAHFILQYDVQTKGVDMGYLYARTRNNYLADPYANIVYIKAGLVRKNFGTGSFVFTFDHTCEDVASNKQLGRDDMSTKIVLWNDFETSGRLDQYLSTGKMKSSDYALFGSIKFVSSGIVDFWIKDNIKQIHQYFNL